MFLQARGGASPHKHFVEDPGALNLYNRFRLKIAALEGARNLSDREFPVVG